jgi:hypothetical protein
MEFLVAAGILAFVLCGLLLLFVNCVLINELNRNFTLCYNAIQAKMEEIKNTGFDNLFTSYAGSCPAGAFCNGDTFNIEGFPAGNSQGVIRITGENSTLKRIRITACFKSRNRLIGNSLTGCSSSPAELVTLIAR